MDSLVEAIKKEYTSKGKTIATAESCTAGLLSAALTGIAGSSAYYVGGVVSYSNEAKQTLLGVKLATLKAVGAVSEDVACEMASGVREALNADVGVSVTGVAGPGGGTEEKPVGLTWIGISTADGTTAHRFVWAGDRAANRTDSVGAALDLLLKGLK